MKKFYLGMDIGTDSVGMACTDEEYNILRAKGKDLWVVRLFDEAKDASERRIKRTARRRLQRRRQRIEFLQGVFAPFMEDATFFLRLNNSGFEKEDKNEKLNSKFSLFSDADYTDVEFYKAFPTIFHLRKALIDGTNQKIDLRHYYLALHHLIKYRGHFLFEGEDVGELMDVKKLFIDYNIAASETGLDLQLEVDKAEDFKSLAMSKKSLNEKKKECYAIFNTKDIALKEVIDMILGAKATASNIWGEEFKEKYKGEKISFKEWDDDTFAQQQEIYEEEHYELLSKARAIYNYILFAKVLAGHSCISEAMVAIYEKHQKDLKLLKVFVKANYPRDVYYKIFRSTAEKSNYANYIGYNKNKKGKIFVQKQNEIAEFYKFLKSVLGSTARDNETLQYILKEIENANFLPKILNADNGLFPHQINGMELNCILQNLQQQYPQFAIKDDSGYTCIEKIKKIFLYKIPYYIGPLNQASPNAWVAKKENFVGKITPWNFDEAIDKAQSNENFIRRMTNKCTYLRGQDVLPKGSMYYQTFDTLNQINKLTIGSIPVSVEIKKEIFENVYLKHKKVSVKSIGDYLLQVGKISKEELKETPIGGYDVKSGLKASMSSYVLFKEKFGDIVDKAPDIFENIILWHTLNTDKTLVENMILDHYGNVAIIKENVKWLKGLTSFKEFGKLSKKLLCEIAGGVDSVTGEVYTILNCLYNTNDNFNQLLFNEKYSFNNAIDEENSGTKKEDITYDDVAGLYVSPMVRRGVWQALKMADEYVEAVGKIPDKIFIEVTRQDGVKGDKGRTLSRKVMISNLYKSIEKDCYNLEKLLNELNHEDMTDSRLRQESLFLYFMQLGRCAYTGEIIDIEDLKSGNYNVDHIIPQSMTKDDSLDNKVLVKREKNEEKTDIYPLPLGFSNQQAFWKLLKSKGLMSDVKYSRLMRTKPLSEDDLREFVNRQLVVTNQTVKAVAELLKQKYGVLGTKIVYSKAKNVDDFKQKFEFVKCRETNDLHHARDAYLNVVVGNVYDTKFSSAYDYFYRKQDGFWREYNLKYLFNKVVDGAWKGEEDVARIKKIASKTSMKVTRYAYVNQGAFYDETVYGKNETSISAPRKNCLPYNQTEKYGGYKSLSTAYFAIVESKDKKGNIIKTIEAIPILVDYLLKNDSDAILNYLNKKGLKSPKIILPKLKVKTLVRINGYNLWLAGITGQQIILRNAQQWFTNSATDLYVKQLIKLVEMDKKGKLSDEEKESEEIALIANRKGVTLYATKEKNRELYSFIIETLNKNAYQGLSSVKSFKEKLQEKADIFNNLSTFEQIKTLLQIVRFMKCNAETADLTTLKDGASCGKLLIGKNITDVNFEIVHQSPCGLIENIRKI
ncbi:MAG: type II CRISPR RNA-guided endonuclease Cas9 [Clostridia bacterium]|nr:type II CRISPR RNA-guided endonuclease Cas9 [Clostridia bacterium]